MLKNYPIPTQLINSKHPKYILKVFITLLDLSLPWGFTMLDKKTISQKAQTNYKNTQKALKTLQELKIISITPNPLSPSNHKITINPHILSQIKKDIAQLITLIPHKPNYIISNLDEYKK